MTEQDFKRRYCGRSNISEAEFDKHMVVLECSCGEDGCLGWAAISNTPHLVNAHKRQFQSSGIRGELIELCLRIRRLAEQAELDLAAFGTPSAKQDDKTLKFPDDAKAQGDPQWL